MRDIADLDHTDPRLSDAPRRMRKVRELLDEHPERALRYLVDVCGELLEREQKAGRILDLEEWRKVAKP
jgi:hypothetical protein